MYVKGWWDALAAPWRACLEEAWDAYRAGSNPIGACVADAADRVVGRGRNRIRDSRPPAPQLAGHRLAHAEVNALLDASAWDGEPRSLTVYTTVEPCPLCAGAIAMAGVRAVRYASRDPWAGSASLFVATPYLRAKAISFDGPRDDLEVALKAMGIEYLLTVGGRRIPEIVGAARAAMPAAVVLGESLRRSGELRALASEGVRAATAIGRLVALASEVVPVH